MSRARAGFLYQEDVTKRGLREDFNKSDFIRGSRSGDAVDDANSERPSNR